MANKYTVEQAYSMNSKGLDYKDGWHTMCNGEWGNTYRYKADAEAALRAEGLTKDRKTGEWYNPQERFDATMAKPEIMAVLQRMSAR